MKTFDFELAWQQIMLPAFKQLPTQVHVLLKNVALECAELHQLPDCSMPWPDDGGKLREQFDRVSGDVLSHAAHVVYFYGHWHPGESFGPKPPGSNHGAAWKFSHYADQVLRGRFNLSENGRDSRAAVSFAIIEGTIRLCYSSRDCWNWHEVAPATDAGMETAKKLHAGLSAQIAGKLDDDRDNEAHKFFGTIENIKAWPDMDTAGFMVEESDLETRRVARMPKPDKEKLRAKIVQDFNEAMQIKTTERDGNLWLVEHDLPTENCIFYSHLGQFCFGWRTPYTGEAREKLLAALAEFPFSYDVK